MRRTNLLSILAAGALAACGGGNQGAGTPASGSNVTLDAPASDGTRTGALVANGRTVRFTAGPVTNGVAQAEFDLVGGTDKVVSQVSAPDTGTITISGVTLDGNGALTPAEDAAVKSLASGKLAEAIALIPLEIGCHDAAIDPVQLAALLMPWQLVLKYAVPTRVDAVTALAAAATCQYFPDPTIPSDGGITLRAAGSPFMFSHDHPVPTALGYFPFDEDGAVETTGSTSSALAGDTLGPCNALCRGACGPDCEPRNCVGNPEWRCVQDQDKVNTGFKQRWIVQHCGTADGCRVHDDCYDTCHSADGCGTWDAAYCRRGCDQEACYDHPTECARWAVGLGDFDGYLDFPYIDSQTAPLEDQTMCPQVPALDPKWQDPPSDTQMSYADAGTYCAGLTLQGATWRLPEIDELHDFVQGCSTWDCSPVDVCNGCQGAVNQGPGAGGCYWSPAAHGTCDAYWSATPFAYEDGMNWAVQFQDGHGGAGNDSFLYYVRCIKNP